MSSFFAERLDVLSDSNRNFQTHWKVLRQAAYALQTTLRVRWNVEGKECSLGRADGDKFREGDFPEPNEHQEMNLLLRVQFEQDKETRWAFFVPIELRRSRQAVSARIGTMDAAYQIAPSAVGEYNFGEVVQRIEAFLANATDEIAEQQRLK